MSWVASHVFSSAMTSGFMQPRAYFRTTSVDRFFRSSSGWPCSSTICADQRSTKYWLFPRKRSKVPISPRLKKSFAMAIPALYAGEPLVVGLAGRMSLKKFALHCSTNSSERSAVDLLFISLKLRKLSRLHFERFTDGLFRQRTHHQVARLGGMH